MAKSDLVKFIEENLSDKNGGIDLTNLKLHRSVNTSFMKVKGHLYQYSKKVDMDLLQNLQKVKGKTFK